MRSGHSVFFREDTGYHPCCPPAARHAQRHLCNNAVELLCTASLVRHARQRWESLRAHAAEQRREHDNLHWLTVVWHTKVQAAEMMSLREGQAAIRPPYRRLALYAQMRRRRRRGLQAASNMLQATTRGRQRDAFRRLRVNAAKGAAGARRRGTQAAAAAAVDALSRASAGATRRAAWRKLQRFAAAEREAGARARYRRLGSRAAAQRSLMLLQDRRRRAWHRWRDWATASARSRGVVPAVAAAALAGSAAGSHRHAGAALVPADEHRRLQGEAEGLRRQLADRERALGELREEHAARGGEQRGAEQALRRLQQDNDELRRKMQQEGDDLRRKMQQDADDQRREMQRDNDALRQQLRVAEDRARDAEDRAQKLQDQLDRAETARREADRARRQALDDQHRAEERLRAAEAARERTDQELREAQEDLHRQVADARAAGGRGAAEAERRLQQVEQRCSSLQREKDAHRSAMRRAGALALLGSSDRALMLVCFHLLGAYRLDREHVRWLRMRAAKEKFLGIRACLLRQRFHTWRLWAAERGRGAALSPMRSRTRSGMRRGGRRTSGQAKASALLVAMHQSWMQRILFLWLAHTVRWNIRHGKELMNRAMMLCVGHVGDATKVRKEQQEKHNEYMSSLPSASPRLGRRRSSAAGSLPPPTPSGSQSPQPQSYDASPSSQGLLTRLSAPGHTAADWAAERDLQRRFKFGMPESPQSDGRAGQSPVPHRDGDSPSPSARSGTPPRQARTPVSMSRTLGDTQVTTGTSEGQISTGPRGRGRGSRQQY